MASLVDRWEWSDQLDALTAAPEYHRVLLENEHVRVLLTHVPVGATTPVHTHRWPSVEYVLSGSNLVRRDGEGNILLDTRVAGGELQPSQAMWAASFPPHSVENVSNTELRVLMVEFKDSR